MDNLGTIVYALALNRVITCRFSMNILGENDLLDSLILVNNLGEITLSW